MSNKIDYLEQKATPKILEIISDNNGKYTWYNIELRMNRLRGYPKTPPTFYILKELVKLGMIKELPPEGDSKYPTFEITKSGWDFLEESKIKEKI